MSSELLSIAEARHRVLERVDRTVTVEPVALAGALGRVLAEEARAPEDVPGFDNSAMDGFAVRAADTSGAGTGAPVRLALAGESRAGAPAQGELDAGHAIRISTGGVLPTGADAVVRLEEAAVSNGSIEFEIEVAAGRDIRRAGEDVRAGTTVLGPGAELGPAELGVLASLGIAEPICFRRPRLAVICTGDELLAPNEPMVPGGVRNSNAYTVPALARAANAEVVEVTRVRDEPEATRDALARALEADVAVCCGGVSVGEHDHVKQAFRDLGAEEVFWGVALRPGRPTWFGTRDDGEHRTFAFGLPGNPVSAFVTFVLFARPVLHALTGVAGRPESASARLARDVPRLPKRDQAVRCSLELRDDGWHADPTGPQGSHILTSMLGAHALALIEAGPGPAREGEIVPIELLRT